MKRMRMWMSFSHLCATCYRKKNASSLVPNGIMPLDAQKDFFTLNCFVHECFSTCSLTYISLACTGVGMHIPKFYLYIRYASVDWGDVSCSERTVADTIKTIHWILTAIWSCLFFFTKIETLITRVISKRDKSHFKWLEMFPCCGPFPKWFCKSLPVGFRWVCPWKIVVQMLALGGYWSWNICCFILPSTLPVKFPFNKN